MSAAIVRARLLADAGRHEQAIELLAGHLAAEPDDPTAWLLLSTSQLALGNGHPSLQAANEAVRLDPDNDESHAAAGLALMKGLKRPLAAVPAFDEALRLNPHAAHHLHNRAMALHGARRNKAALSDVDQALELAPYSANSHLLRGVILSSMRHRRASRAATRTALTLQPQLALAHNNVAVDQLRRGRVGGAAAALDRAITADPHDRLIQRNIEAVLLKLARRLFIVGLLITLACFAAAELLWAPWVRALVGVALVVAMLVTVLSPLRRLSVGGRRYLFGRVRHDRFLLFSCLLGLFSGALALTISLLPLTADEGLGQYVGVLLIINISYGLWSRRWVANRRAATE